jgi:hypothetical protein
MVRTVFRTMICVFLAVLITFVLRKGYVQAVGYKASKVETDLCGGNWMVYQETDGFYNMLRCLQTLKIKPLPPWFAHLRVDPDERFTLGGIDELCSKGMKPKDVKGTLKCIPY